MKDRSNDPAHHEQMIHEMLWEALYKYHTSLSKNMADAIPHFDLVHSFSSVMETTYSTTLHLQIPDITISDWWVYVIFVSFTGPCFQFYRHLSICKGLTCTFRASCYSARLSWALVLTWVSPSSKIKKVWVWVGRMVGYLVTTFTLKEHYCPVQL